MRIDSSRIGMESGRTYSSVSARISKLTITNVKRDLADGTGSLFGNLSQALGNGTGEAKKKKESGNFAERTMEEMSAKRAMRNANVRTVNSSESRKQLREIRQQCLSFLLNMFYGGQSMWDRDMENNASDFGSDSTASFWTKSPASANMKTFTFSREYYFEETETTSFTTQGTVKCADGREIDFNLNLYMSRSFQEYYKEDYAVKTVSMCDPLVINLDGNIAELSDQTFFFDIDGDGEKDEISRLSSGSGYLALDKNGDGVINDGTELFGTASGNGFADLAKYDLDGNGFIDEGDEIWNKLKIWIIDENGKEQLVSLSEKGVGAICLANTSTDFALTGEDNSVKGMIRNTGFFLYESGAVGSIQHVDVAKYSQSA